MGHTQLGKLLLKACSDAGIKGKKTNHSLRKSAVKDLARAGIQDTNIMKITGHRSLSSLTHYNKDIDLEDHQNISKILCTAGAGVSHKKKCSKTATSTRITDDDTTVTTTAMEVSVTQQMTTKTTTAMLTTSANTETAIEVSHANTSTTTATKTSSIGTMTMDTATSARDTTTVTENQTFGSSDHPLPHNGSFVFSGTCTFNNCTFYLK